MNPYLQTLPYYSGGPQPQTLPYSPAGPAPQMQVLPYYMQRRPQPRSRHANVVSAAAERTCPSGGGRCHALDVMGRSYHPDRGLRQPGLPDIGADLKTRQGLPRRFPRRTAGKRDLSKSP